MKNTLSQRTINRLTQYYTILRDYSKKVYLLEHQSDKTSGKLRRAVFDSDLDLAEKIQINSFVEEVADIADLAEDCIDSLLIFAIKREI